MAEDVTARTDGRRCRVECVSLAAKQVILYVALWQTWAAVSVVAAAEPSLQKTDLFTAGTAGYATYRILFANPHNPDDRRRKNVTVKLSYDEGETWPVTRSVEPGISGYSDMAAAPDGFAYCLYERGSVDTSHYRPAHLTVARFNLEWMTEGADHFE